MSRKRQSNKRQELNNANVALFQNGKAMEEGRKIKHWTTHDIKSIRALTPAQEDVFHSWFNEEHICLHGSAGTGKTFLGLYLALNEVLQKNQHKIIIVRSAVATREVGFLPGPQPLNVKILTPDGWTTMGELKIGDYVMGRNGKPTKITGIYPQGKKDIYEIQTTTGKRTLACGEHLWKTQTFNDYKHNKEGSIKTTLEIKSDLTYKSTNKLNHYLPRREPMVFNSKKLPLDPYVLGALLGDGSLGEAICISVNDKEIIDYMNYKLKDTNISVRESKGITHTLGASDNRPNKPIGKNEQGRTTNPIKEIIKKLGLFKKHFDTKFIPKEYLCGTTEERLELLRGLLDTDGSVHKGQAEFHSSGKLLVDSVVELVQSLGGSTYVSVRDRSAHKAMIGEREIIPTCECYMVGIRLPNEMNPFMLPRKANKLITRTKKGNIKKPTCDIIKNIELVSNDYVQCISVEDEEHLYITDNYIVTHNTLEEKVAQYETPYRDILAELIGKESTYNDMKDAKIIEFMPTSFIRGLTWDNAVVIVDEFQNMQMQEIDSVLTRVGQNTRVILCGDIKHQCDLKQEQTCATRLLNIIKKMNNFADVNFTYHDIVRSEFVKEWIIASE